MAKLSYEFCEFVYDLLTINGGVSVDAYKVLQKVVDVAGSKSQIMKEITDRASIKNNLVMMPVGFHTMPFDEFVQNDCGMSCTAGMASAEDIECRLPFKYKMELVRNDMIRMLELLNSESRDPSEETLEWARDLRSGILGTIGIEEI